MYSKTQWGGAIDPFILVTFVKDDSPPDRTVSLIIFEYRDKNLLGKPIGDDPDQVRDHGKGRVITLFDTNGVESVEDIHLRSICRSS